MESYIFWFIFFIIIALGVGLLWFAKRKKRGLSAEKTEFYRNEIKKCFNLGASEKILQYDKILNHILKDLGYEGSVGDQLKAKPFQISDLDIIWKLHKVRNQIAHELGQISEVKMSNDAKRYEKELLKILEY